MPLSPIPDILDELRAGRMIVLVDDENRENEGDLVCAAEFVTPQAVQFMVRHTPGYLCVTLTPADCERLDLHPQTTSNNSVRGTPMAVSVDGHPRHGVGTGISASDRAKTIQIIADPNAQPNDLVRPGHMVPLRARAGGVLVRTGQTEGSVDLMKLAGLRPAAVISEVCRDDGEMARLPELETLCAEHDLKMCSVEQIIEYRLEREALVERLDPVAGTTIDTPEGVFNLIAYHSTIDPLPHLALTVGGVGDLDERGHVLPVDEPVLVRMHRRDLLGDIFNDQSNPTADELHASMQMIQDAGRGALVYLRPEGYGEGLSHRLQRIRRPAIDDVNAPDLTRTDGVAARAQPMENRDFGMGGQILRDLGLQRLRILTNHPKTYTGLSGFGLEIVEQVAITACGVARSF
jgi:3,4-dihydroxy 2-butanone 4-phosphate synthase/GTP cyclohydrolase II